MHYQIKSNELEQMLIDFLCLVEVQIAYVNFVCIQLTIAHINGIYDICSMMFVL